MESSEPIELSREVEEAIDFHIRDIRDDIAAGSHVDNQIEIGRYLARAIIAQVREENWPISGRFIDTAD